MNKPIYGYISIPILFFSIISGALWYITSPTKSEAENIPTEKKVIQHTGKYVVVHLKDMNLTLFDGTSTIATFPLVSIGKPGSYYETIGGYYINDYKEPLHFSTIGHVYMPYSVHIFGNFFLHGIPYYEDGTKVSSSYSGGCIRLSEDDSKVVYDFIKTGTPIIITENTEYDFNPTEISTELIENVDMTRIMVSIISLEVLTQDNEILYNNSSTTRRTLLPDLLTGNNEGVSLLYAQALGEDTFTSYMNMKAKSIGLTNTVFKDVISPAVTTQYEYAQFMQYITTYKSYVAELLYPTATFSQ